MSRFILSCFNNKEQPRFFDYINHPLLSLEKALQPVLSNIDDLDYQIKQVECRRYPLEHNLTKDESVAVCLFTMESDKQNLHNVLNRALTSGNYSLIEPWFGYLKLLKTALGKLPIVKEPVWCVIHDDIAKNLKENEEIILYSVSSCSLSIDKIRNFLDSTSNFCSIKVLNGKNVRGYTQYVKEDEVLLLPGTRLRVKSKVLDPSTDKYALHMEEIRDDNKNGVQTSNNSEANGNQLNSLTTFTNGDHYEVSYKNGKKYGYGVYYPLNREKLEGSLADDKANGPGSRTWSNGNRYEGTFNAGKMHGYGSLSCSNGYAYVGNWINDEAYGQGTSTWPNGNQYEGIHENGRIHGHGTFSAPNGDKYVGYLINGKANGEGKRIWSNGDRYEGTFKNDKKNGFGTYYYSKGGRYIGDWVDDDMNGEGLLLWPSGSKYAGTFKKGKRHGEGKLTFANGKIQDGQWENDIFIG